MGKERLAAFTDAVLAIIMTILVLDLPKPDPVSWEGVARLGTNLFAYAVSFFWLGIMWFGHHNNWDLIERVSSKTVLLSLVMLFFASLFPYTTSLAAENFMSPVAQTLYGLDVLATTFSNMGLSSSLGEANPTVKFGRLYTIPARVIAADLGMKAAGLVAAVTVWPPAMMVATLACLVLIAVERTRDAGHPHA